MAESEGGNANAQQPDERVLWVARVFEPDAEADGGAAAAGTVRMWTEGEAPGPDSEVEAIEDPFDERRVRGEASAWEAAHAPALADGLSGKLAQYRLAPPVRARKVIGIGRNYAAHAAELGNEVPTTPLSFFKAPTCLLASGEPIELPAGFSRIDMEAELVVVMGSRARQVSKAQAWQHIAGYCLGNDVSCRDLQKSDKQWTRAKGMDSFGPVGPFVRMTPPGFVPPIASMSVHGYVGDERRQDGACSLMIFDIPTLIEHLTQFITLEPGDLIYTGTPAGVSALGPGTVSSVYVQGFELGRLTNVCVAAPTGTTGGV